MAFAAIHIPNFLVQAVIRAEPALSGAATALVDGTPPLWNVVAANEAALRIGIELGMAQTLAEEFETVQVRHRSRAQEKAAHAALLDLGWSVSPRVEDTAPDTIVIDLTGLSSLFGSDGSIASQLAERAVALGLTAQVAVASSIQVSIHASRGFPGITLIAPGEESKRLGCLPVGVLVPSVEILETLESWGVRTCEALAALPVLSLSERLGQEGVQLHEWARGAIVRSMILAEPNMRFEEEMELDDSVEELEPLAFLLARLLNQLCTRLKARSLAFRAIYLRFDLDLSGKKDLQVRDEYSRKTSKENIYEKTLTLPIPIQDSKMLLNLLRLQLQSDPPSAPILKILMAVEPSRPRTTQTGLFLPASPDPEKLELTIARLAKLVGDSNIGSPQLVDTHRPGNFRMDRFVPSREESKAPGRKNSAFTKTKRPDKVKPATCFRMFRPPLPANVQLKEGSPQRVSFRGTQGEVVNASGPWRTSGDWWREDAWHQDEWDLEIRFSVSSSHREQSLACCPQQGLYRLYYDSICQRWFVRGIYD